MSFDQDSLGEALHELGTRIGQDCMPDPSGVVSFTAGDLTLSIEARPTDDTAYFHVAIRRLSEMPPDVLGAAMAYNLFRQPLPGSWLALDGETDELVLCYAAAKAGLDADRILALLDALAEAAEAIAVGLGRAEAPAAAEPMLGFIRA